MGSSEWLFGKKGNGGHEKWVYVWVVLSCLFLDALGELDLDDEERVELGLGVGEAWRYGITHVGL